MLLADVHRVFFGNDTWLHHWLDYRIALSGTVLRVVDALRYVGIVLGGLLVAWNVKSASSDWSALDWCRAAFFTGFGLYCAAVMADALSQPLLVWSLPTLLVLEGLGFAVQLQRTRRDSTAPPAVCGEDGLKARLFRRG
jgi:hypothetical protein